MKVAIAHGQNRISPVFDVTNRLLLVELKNGKEVSRADSALSCCGFIPKAREVHQLGIQVLLCGAISRPMETALNTIGVRVIGFICGDLEDVLNAYIQGRLTEKCFQMPGHNQKTGAKDKLT